MTAVAEIPAAETPDLTTELRKAADWAAARIATIDDELAALTARLEEASWRNDAAQAAAFDAGHLEWTMRKCRSPRLDPETGRTPIDDLYEAVQLQAKALDRAATAAEKAVGALRRERDGLLDERMNLRNLATSLRRTLGEPELEPTFGPEDEGPF